MCVSNDNRAVAEKGQPNRTPAMCVSNDNDNDNSNDDGRRAQHLPAFELAAVL